MHLNAILRPFLQFCLQNKISVETKWVPSEKMQADSLSRWSYDVGDYTLNRALFLHLQGKMLPYVKPLVDMFSSPGNRQLDQFVSKWPHHLSVATNALLCNLDPFTDVYANPPWSVINQWLLRLKSEKHLRCMLICPFWTSAVWWTLLIKLHIPKTPRFLYPPFTGCS